MPGIRDSRKGPTSLLRPSDRSRKLELPNIHRRTTDRHKEEEEEPYREQNYIDEALGNLFHEYFIKNGFIKTLECFQKEQREDVNNNETEEFKTKLLSVFWILFSPSTRVPRKNFLRSSASTRPCTSG